MTGVTRYVVTHINRDGMRTLSDAMQGQYTYATPAEAQSRMEAFTANNSTDTIRSVFGEAPAFEVRPVECWPIHFDPKTCWFD